MCIALSLSLLEELLWVWVRGKCKELSLPFGHSSGHWQIRAVDTEPLVAPAMVEFGTGLCAHHLGQMIKTFLRGSVLSETRVPGQWHTHGGRTCVPVTRAGERYLLLCLCC